MKVVIYIFNNILNIDIGLKQVGLHFIGSTISAIFSYCHWPLYHCVMHCVPQIFYLSQTKGDNNQLI